MYKFNVLINPDREGKANFYRLQTCAMSIRGREKSSNEDFVFHRTAQTPGTLPVAFMVVCDGMGGHQLGSFASELATHIITTEMGKLFPYQDYFNAHIQQPTIPRTSQLQTWLSDTIKEANRLIFEYCRNQPDVPHSGTRLTLALIHSKTAHIAHVGDTRAYAWREGELTQITEDHSMAAELEKGGILETSELLHHPLRKVLSRSIGTQPEVNPAFYTVPLMAGDKLMLCSDGLWAAFDDVHRIAEILMPSLHPNDLCANLIDEARIRNNRDDISVAVACVQGPPEN